MSAEITPYPLGDIFELWRPGSGDWTWGDEAADIIRVDGAAFAEMVERMALYGLREPTDDEEPICLGDDGRVWEGHHRLIAALLCGIEHAPVTFGHTPRPDDVKRASSLRGGVLRAASQPEPLVASDTDEKRLTTSAQTDAP